jgi:UDPglucose 6-dehydrogenase
VEAFIHIAGKLGYRFGFLEEVKKINEEQRSYFVARIKERLWVLKGKKIAILGLTFKPDTDDMRFAPSIDIVNALIAEGAAISVYDPQAAEAKAIFKDRVVFAQSILEATRLSDCACFLTEWPQFKKINLIQMKKTMRHALVADGRNMLDKNKLIKAGFDYIGIGR